MSNIRCTSLSTRLCPMCLQAILESLEAQLPQQLPGVSSELLASGLWAMARLQLQPQQELIATVADHLLQPDRQFAQTFWQGSSSSAFVSAACRTRLAGCSTRSFGTFCYSLNFFLLRDAHFWSVAAAVALQHLAQLQSANISNLLQGLAVSGWVLDPGALGPQQVSSSRLGVETQQGAVSADGGDGAADAVSALLTALEASLLAAPRQLRLWRLRDISQLAQSCALIGFRCGPLFAVIAQHLLEYSQPYHEQAQLAAAAAQQQQQLVMQQRQRLSLQQQRNPQQQQQRPAWTAPGSSRVMAAAYPDSGSSSPSPQVRQQPAAASSRPWHDKGRGPARLTECRAGDAVGLAWAYVHSFCPNQMLLQELAGVLTHRAGQLHAADVSRLLWAYATAEVRHGGGGCDGCLVAAAGSTQPG